jgi:succinoglycan biosynthesis protein ExoA
MPQQSRNTPQNTPANTSSSRQTHSISIVIPSAPGRSFNEIMENLRRVRPAQLTMQIIVVKGTWPPLQRNLAIKKAGGDFIFLFDDDIIIDPGIIEKVLEDFTQNPGIDVIGGPNLTPPEDGFMQHCFGLAHSSYFTGAQTAARYFPARRLKKVTESHLISCNLAFRADVLKKNPFDPHIFPNEENDLLARLQRLKHKFSYDPGFFVYHHRRNNLGGYVKQIFNWGAGRALHSLNRPSHFNPVFLVPLAFLFYLISLAFFQPFWYLSPLILYLLLDLAFSISAAIRAHRIRPFYVMIWLFPLTHIIYALGLVSGVARHFRRPPELPKEDGFQTIEINIT